MPIPESSVQINAYFVTPTDQLRKVTDLTQDDQGKTRVHYLSKSGKIVGRKFWSAATASNPASLENFAHACSKKLSEDEVANLREKGILLSGE